MSAQHTLGRLSIQVLTGTETNGQSIFQCGLGLRHHSFSDEQEANAQRLVACWNACESVPTEVLEAQQAGGLPWSVPDQIDRGVIAKEMLAALRGLEVLYLREGESWNDCFERVGELFHAETGYLRPGKDCRIHDDTTRTKVWEKWVEVRIGHARAAIAKGSNGFCATCGGRGEIGGFVNAEMGYQTDPCPECTPAAKTSLSDAQGERR